jgi:hypothetical protein
MRWVTGVLLTVVGLGLHAAPALDPVIKRAVEQFVPVADSLMARGKAPLPRDAGRVTMGAVPDGRYRWVVAITLKLGDRPGNMIVGTGFLVDRRTVLTSGRLFAKAAREKMGTLRGEGPVRLTRLPVLVQVHTGNGSATGRVHDSLHDVAEIILDTPRVPPWDEMDPSDDLAILKLKEEVPIEVPAFHYVLAEGLPGIPEAHLVAFFHGHRRKATIAGPAIRHGTPRLTAFTIGHQATRGTPACDPGSPVFLEGADGSIFLLGAMASGTPAGGRALSAQSVKHAFDAQDKARPNEDRLKMMLVRLRFRLLGPYRRDELQKLWDGLLQAFGESKKAAREFFVRHRGFSFEPLPELDADIKEAVEQFATIPASFAQPGDPPKPEDMGRVTGQPAGNDRYGWVVAIAYKRKGKRGSALIGSGFLIDQETVLTAWHLFDTERRGLIAEERNEDPIPLERLPSVIQVYTGMGTADGVFLDSLHDVSEVVLDTQYSSVTNDLAIVRLSKRVRIDVPTIRYVGTRGIPELSALHSIGYSGGARRKATIHHPQEIGVAWSCESNLVIGSQSSPELAKGDSGGPFFVESDSGDIWLLGVHAFGSSAPNIALGRYLREFCWDTPMSAQSAKHFLDAHDRSKPLVYRAKMEFVRVWFKHFGYAQPELLQEAWDEVSRLFKGEEKLLLTEFLHGYSPALLKYVRDRKLGTHYSVYPLLRPAVRTRGEERRDWALERRYYLTATRSFARMFLERHTKLHGQEKSEAYLRAKRAAVAIIKSLQRQDVDLRYGRLVD